ncbi:DUF4908 domain-containing protein [Maricaulis sp.]|uniref:DUF4908 domain-containing protein n=2 Tax=unclassified Maricaulis TaxID=2632371 RepID=UPI001B1B65A1|nr:DUF4908 domain-containing protein [Maricaulis sp.]MBO6796594.1 DUF4908 domain-containing protein [Maricaulis sp.]
MMYGMTRILIAILTAAMCAGAAAGYQANPLRDRLLRNERSQLASSWYQRADSGDFFLFDRTNTVALLRERDDPDAEVLVLFANRAPGGGTSFVTDTGREVVRLTALGGTTYFPLDAPDGVIADYASPAGGLAPQPRSPNEVRDRAEDLAGTLAELLSTSFDLEYEPAPRAGLGVQYDTFNVIEKAVRQLRSDRRRMPELARLRIVIGGEPGARWDDDEFVVSIAPEFGYAGRPSSELIANALMDETS